MNQPGLERQECFEECSSVEPAFVAALGVFAVEPAASVSLEPELRVAQAVPAGAADNMAVLVVSALSGAASVAVEPAVRSLQVLAAVLAEPGDSAGAGSGAAAAVYSATLLFHLKPA